jgi:hypothetical protein
MKFVQGNPLPLEIDSPVVSQCGFFILEKINLYLGLYSGEDKSD